MNTRVGQGLHACYVLHQRPYSNSSLLLECYLRDHGRLPAIARGGRSGRSPWRGLLQPFRELLAGFSGRGEVLTLTAVESAAEALPIVGQRIYCGFYLNELLVRLVPRYDAHETLFADYRRALRELAEGVDLDRCLRRFELRLLEELGYGLSLEMDSTGEPVRSECCYRYEMELGLVPLAAEVAGPLHGETLLALAQERELDPQPQTEARRLLRAVLSHYLGNRPLKSRELFRMTTNVPNRRTN